MSLTPLPQGHIGVVVTYLEMIERPFLPELARGGGPPGEAGRWRGEPLPPAPLRLIPWPAPAPDRYRSLFRKVGARWLWYSRLLMDDAKLRAEMAEVHAILNESGAEVGLLELDFRTEGECLIRFLGLVPELAGQGHGGWLFAQSLALAWRPEVRRVAVNTCTLDHPAALPAYLRAGFRAYERAFESFPDPRLAGLLPADSAPQLPLIGAGAGPASWR
jgi:GNAT superfamily N-acetyltransferase